MLEPHLARSIVAQRGVIVGFHGCSKNTSAKVLDGKDFINPSSNEEDWLGWGAYFWENDFDRALEWAKALHPQNPDVVGCLINPGHCLSLIESPDLALLAEEYIALSDDYRSAGMVLPENKVLDEQGRPRRRLLDCLVINSLNQRLKAKGQPAFDTVRAAFEEGGELYRGSTFRTKNHIQVCVRNPRCIVGYFRVLRPCDCPHWVNQ